LKEARSVWSGGKAAKPYLSLPIHISSMKRVLDTVARTDHVITIASGAQYRRLCPFLRGVAGTRESALQVKKINKGSKSAV